MILHSRTLCLGSDRSGRATPYNKEGPQCKKNRLRRATAAQRPSIVRKSLYIDVLAKILDLRGGSGGAVFFAEKRGGARFGGARFFGPRLQHCPGCEPGAEPRMCTPGGLYYYYYYYYYY